MIEAGSATEIEDVQAVREAKIELVAKGHPHSLHVVCDNLLEKTWLFSRKKRDSRIEFGSYKKGRLIIYYIKYNGAGFDSANAEKLFDPFQWLHTGNEFEGTGIGLATVPHIIHRRGERTWAEGAIDEETAFYFTL